MNSYHSIQKQEKKDGEKVTNFIPSKEGKLIINSLIFLAFSKSSFFQNLKIDLCKMIMLSLLASTLEKYTPQELEQRKIRKQN